MRRGNGVAEAFRNVPGVDQKRCADALSGDLGAKRSRLGEMGERERVRCRTCRGQTEPRSGRKVRRRVEAGDRRGTGSGNRSIRVGAATPHLDRASPVSGRNHSARRRSDGAVVIEDRQNHRFEHHGFGESRLDGEDRTGGEVHLAFGITPHIAAESIPGEPLEGASRETELA